MEISSIEHGGTRAFSIITVPDGLPAHEGTRPFSKLWLYRPSKWHYDGFTGLLNGIMLALQAF